MLRVIVLRVRRSFIREHDIQALQGVCQKLVQYDTGLESRSMPDRKDVNVSQSTVKPPWIRYNPRFPATVSFTHGYVHTPCDDNNHIPMQCQLALLEVRSIVLLTRRQATT